MFLTKPRVKTKWDTLHVPAPLQTKKKNEPAKIYILCCPFGFLLVPFVCLLSGPNASPLELSLGIRIPVANLAGTTQWVTFANPCFKHVAFSGLDHAFFLLQEPCSGSLGPLAFKRVPNIPKAHIGRGRAPNGLRCAWVLRTRFASEVDLET